MNALETFNYSDYYCWLLWKNTSQILAWLIIGKVVVTDYIRPLYVPMVHNLV